MYEVALWTLDPLIYPMLDQLAFLMVFRDHFFTERFLFNTAKSIPRIIERIDDLILTFIEGMAGEHH